MQTAAGFPAKGCEVKASTWTIRTDMSNYDNVKDVGVTVWRAEKGDFGCAWAIVSEYYEAVGVVVREDRQDLEMAYFAPGAGLWLAKDGDEVVGCIALRHLEGFPSAGEVKRLYVKPQSRGRGIAGLLLDALHEYARQARYTTLYLDSKDDLIDALRFYRKRGYQVCERYNDNPQATVFMKLSLSGSPVRGEPSAG